MSELRKISGKYYSDQDNVIDKLYAPCLKWATTYVRDAGYFSSHIYQAMSREILDFILRDSKNHITLITCIDIYPSDFDAIVSGHTKSADQVIQELQLMLENEVITDPVKMLAAIVASGQMTVYVSLRKRDPQNPHANDHSKSGYFSNGKTIVAFDGSINETFPAVVRGLSKGNKEHFNIYADWEIDANSWGMYAKPIIERLDGDLKGPFPKKSIGEGTIIVEINSLSKDQLPALTDADWDVGNHKKRATKRSHELYGNFENIISSNKELLQTNSDTIEDVTIAPEEGSEMVLRPHQKEGLERWKDNNYNGILRHATGSGKTITALTAIKEHCEQGRPVLILVPSRLLLEQWKKEVSIFMPNANILPVGSGYRNWKKMLGFYTQAETLKGKLRITIAINASARTAGFMQRVSNLNNGLVVVDECHRIGSSSFHEICDWNPEKVLGLSATPERYDDGSSRIANLCGPVIHEYNIEDAISDGYLTQYLYNIETVSLTQTENDSYQEIKEEISKDMRKYIGKNGKIDFSKIPGWLKLKLIQAKRIIKKASEKTEMCGQIIEHNYEPLGNQNWLVYCEDGEQLNAIKTELKHRNISPVHEYWTGAKGAVLGPQDDPQQLEFEFDGTLNTWEREGGILLSIQCLDEGVNIPSISHGIILASSNNPRQFIQRRGRMLRLSPGKQFARIWDAVVIPSTDHSDELNNFILGEIKRADVFSRHAFSGNAALRLIGLKSQFGIVDGIDSFDEEESDAGEGD